MKRTLIILAVLAAAALAVHAGTPIEESRAASPDGQVMVENIAGSVTISGWNKAEVQVTGTLGKNTEPLVFETNNGTTRIEVQPEDRLRGRNLGETILDIRVPRGSRIEVSTVSADIDVTDVEGKVEVETVSGKATVIASPHEVSVESVSGPIQVETASAVIQCGTVSGSILVKAQVPEQVELGSVSGNIDYDGDLARTGDFEAGTISGTIEIRFPAGISADFEVATFSGSIRSELDAPLNLEKDGPVGKSAEFTTGSGDASVEVETLSGSVEFLTR